MTYEQATGWNFPRLANGQKVLGYQVASFEGAEDCARSVLAGMGRVYSPSEIDMAVKQVIWPPIDGRARRAGEPRLWSTRDLHTALADFLAA